MRYASQDLHLRMTPVLVAGAAPPIALRSIRATGNPDDTPEMIMARYNRTTLEEVFLDVARGRVNGAKEATR